MKYILIDGRNIDNIELLQEYLQRFLTTFNNKHFNSDGGNVELLIDDIVKLNPSDKQLDLLLEMSGNAGGVNQALKEGKCFMLAVVGLETPTTKAENLNAENALENKLVAWTGLWDTLDFENPDVKYTLSYAMGLWNSCKEQDLELPDDVEVLDSKRMFNPDQLVVAADLIYDKSHYSTNLTFEGGALSSGSILLVDENSVERTPSGEVDIKAERQKVVEFFDRVYQDNITIIEQ